MQNDETMPRPYTGDTNDIARAIQEFERTLPGWWWCISSCTVTGQASCGPDILSPDRDLIKCDARGIDGLHQDSYTGKTFTCADALRDVMKQALKVKREHDNKIETIVTAKHDLRRKAQRLCDLRRRYELHESLSPEETAELKIGITDEEEIEEYTQIIASIRGERRKAFPSGKTRKKNEEREQKEAQSKPINLTLFMNEEQPL